MPASVWVGPARVDDRIDTRPYKSWVLERIDRCRGFVGGSVRLGADGVCSQLSRGVGGGQPGVDAVAVFKAKEVTGFGFSAPERFVRECASDKVLQAGDIALTSSGIGTIGRADIFYPSAHSTGARFTVDGHVTIIRLDNGGLIPEFVSAFLNCAYGKAWSEWGTTGSTRLLELSPSKVRRFEIPRADVRVQYFVAARVRLAARCRERGDRLMQQAWSRFDQLLCTQQFRPSLMLSNAVHSSRVTGRLDPGFYLRKYFDLDTHVATLGVPVKDVRSLLRSDVTRSSTPERSEDAPIPCILTSDIDPHEIRWRTPSMRISQSVHDGHAGRLAAGDVVYTSVGPPVGEAALVLQQFLPLAAGGDVSILRHGDDLHPGFLALYLNSVFGQMQNDRYSRGIRQRRVYPEDIGAFLIPAFGAKDQAYVGERIVRHQALNEVAVGFVNGAKADVEALIEGTLDVDGILGGKLRAPTADDIPELAEDDA